MNEPGILERAARPFGLAGAIVLVFMMLFTTVTVLMRQLLDVPVLGVVDIMELSLVALIFIAMPGVFLRDENVTVDVIDHVLPRGSRIALRLFGLVVALGFLVMMMIHMIPQAMDKWNYGEVTMTLSINRFTHWVPIMFGFAMSTIGTAWVLVHYIRHGVPKDPNLDRESFE
ncbi:MAG: TRAP transporter small permease subunit [Rhizobiales bacterium]|nr:TRAP transporter small permease subunit [Hyphomicrobiales bacterium]